MNPAELISVSAESPAKVGKSSAKSESDAQDGSFMTLFDGVLDFTQQQQLPTLFLKGMISGDATPAESESGATSGLKKMSARIMDGVVEGMAGRSQPQLVGGVSEILPEGAFLTGQAASELSAEEPVAASQASMGEALFEMMGITAQSILKAAPAEDAQSLVELVKSQAAEVGGEAAPAEQLPLVESGDVAASGTETGERVQAGIPVADVMLHLTKPDRSKLEQKLTAPVSVESENTTQQTAPRPAGVMQPSVPVAVPNNETMVRIEELSEKFDQRLLSMVQRNEQVMKITVEPATLGKVTVLCKQEKDSVSVEIHVQNQGVRDLIARQENDIRRVLMESDIDMSGFDVMLGQQRDGRDSSASGQGEFTQEARGIVPASEDDGDMEPVQNLRHKQAAKWVA
ncbi:MAG: flagellar hook-length control protein FliK [Pontiellaceae bacterium]|nr:flagellar hook-length control protein FliK [Pontiellaceae bacterium]MBN2784116.1 flagellar hook-length control protein FliK [Pontiellaceae bacterium]